MKSHAALPLIDRKKEREDRLLDVTDFAMTTKRAFHQRSLGSYNGPCLALLKAVKLVYRSFNSYTGI